ncbi:hypothetical protein L0F63_007465 [Massospora cicadina]|nr:hypothetical protein L0F63_007465 [Massospora cicadina]
MHHHSRDVSAPELLNHPSPSRSSFGAARERSDLSPVSARPNLSSAGARPNLIYLTVRPNPTPAGARPNLGPVGARPNLSPLAPDRRGVAQLPTPVNMVERLTPQQDEASNALFAFARRLSPRGLILFQRGFNQDTPIQGGFTTPSGQRRVSPTYAENRPQSLFPRGMNDASEIMNKLLASKSPLSSPSPAMRKLRSFTPKLLVRGGFLKHSKVPHRQPTLAGSPPSNSRPIPQKSSIMEALPKEVLEIIFSCLLTPRDVVVCISTCRLWRYPAQNVLNRLIRLRPYAELPMLRTLRLGLKRANVSAKSLSALHDTVWQLSVEYCLCNPYIYPKFCPKNPETMVNHLFWIFLFLDRDFRSASNKRRVSCQKFIKLVHLGIHRGIDRGTLKSLYYDIKSAPLIPDSIDGDSLQDETAVAPSRPHPRRRWWQLFRERGLDASSLGELNEEDDPFRPLN